jgi:pantoate--beta-alanine ligase
MGALHEGHLSLVRQATKKGGCVVVSIFVNPAQFGPGEDFESYPRDPDGDLAALTGEGVDLVFAPTAAEMYPSGRIGTKVDPGAIGEVAEGLYRPGHFAGVATVCVKLFNIVQPDRVYLGQKDAQQVAVLRQIMADLNLPVELVACPTVREKDGLAMSSRNRRLSPEGRRAAAVLHRALELAGELVEGGETSPEEIKTAAREVIAGQSEVGLQYLDVVDHLTFRPVDRVASGSMVILAAFVGPVRLIDNVAVGTAVRPDEARGLNEEEQP